MDARERAEKIAAAVLSYVMSGGRNPKRDAEGIGLAAVNEAYRIDGVDNLLRLLSRLDMETRDSLDFWHVYRDAMDAAARVREAMGDTTPRDGGETGGET